MAQGTFCLRFALGLALAISPLPLAAQGRGQGNGPKGRSENEAAERSRGPIFNRHDRNIIQDYFRRNELSGLPPGLAKRGGNLPPGLEKQLERNGQLPPGLQKRLEPLPFALERQLVRLPRGCRRGIIGDDIVLLDARGRIADILYHIVAGR
jgi:hypothetical protein